MVLFSRAVYNDNCQGRWDRKCIKSQCSIEIFICKFQSFLNKYHPNWFLAQTRLKVRCFKNSLKIIKGFIKSSGLPYFSIKIIFLNKKLSEFMKFFRNCSFPFDFLVRFFKILQVRETRHPEPSTNPYYYIFLNLREKFDKLLKKFEKWQNFHQNFPEIAGFN